MHLVVSLHPNLDGRQIMYTFTFLLAQPEPAFNIQIINLSYMHNQQ
jgi:hypothetical protein